jgi:hypothetical protein
MCEKDFISSRGGRDGNLKIFRESRKNRDETSENFRESIKVREEINNISVNREKIEMEILNFFEIWDEKFFVKITHISNHIPSPSTYVFLHRLCLLLFLELL